MGVGFGQAFDEEVKSFGYKPYSTIEGEDVLMRVTFGNYAVSRKLSLVKLDHLIDVDRVAEEIAKDMCQKIHDDLQKIWRDAREAKHIRR